MTKERKAAPPDPAWPKFEYGNPGSFRYGLATLPNAIAAELGAPVGEAPRDDSRVRLNWKLTKLERQESGGYVASFDTPSGEQSVVARSVVSTAPAHALKEALAPALPGAEVCGRGAAQTRDRTDGRMRRRSGPAVEGTAGTAACALGSR